MKTIETKLYSYQELSDEAKERVIETKAQWVMEDPENFTLQECMVSLKAIVKACGLKLSDWSIGPYNRGNFAKVECDDVGNKALAQFLKVMIDHEYPRPKKFKEMKFEGTCGFTGGCFDDSICEEIWEALLEGDTLGKAFDRAADRIMSICESDLEYATSKEGILEYLDQDEEVYTEDGNKFDGLP